MKQLAKTTTEQGIALGPHIKTHRQHLIQEGIYHFPLAVKQSSVSYAHSDEDMEKTLIATKRAIRKVTS